MTTLTHYLCIGCPLGCRLEVEAEEGHIVEVRGFACKLGKQYAEQEHTAPQRMLTTTVASTGGFWARLPVKTRAPIPKDRVLAACEQLRSVRVAAPVAMGAVIVENILNTGVDIIATRDMPALADALEARHNI